MTSEITDERILWEKRARYNPLLNLTPQKLRTANDAFKVGYLSQAARIWEEVEESEGIISTVADKRHKSVSRLSWNIVPLALPTRKPRNDTPTCSKIFTTIYRGVPPATNTKSADSRASSRRCWTASARNIRYTKSSGSRYRNSASFAPNLNSCLSIFSKTQSANSVCCVLRCRLPATN